MLPLKIAGIGVHFPEQRETKEDFIRRGIPEEIIEKLGVYERRIVERGQTAADLEVGAARQAIDSAGMAPSDIDLVMTYTVLPETLPLPNSALLQSRLGAVKAATFDINQACSSVIPSLIIAANFIALGQYRRILFTVSTHWSVVSDPGCPSCDFVLGDGAAAIVLTGSRTGYGIVSWDTRTDGRYYRNIGFRVGGDRSIRYYDRHCGKLHLFIDTAVLESSVESGFRDFTLSFLPASFKAALAKARLAPADIDCALIHGNVKPLTDAWISRIGVPVERFPLTYDIYGNLSAATVLVNLLKGLNSGMIRRGDTVAMSALGGGYSASSLIFRWD